MSAGTQPHPIPPSPPQTEPDEVFGSALVSPLPEGEGPGVRAPAALGGEVSLAAFFAGLVFMLYPAVQGHLGAGHTGLLVQWPLPLFAWALLRLDRATWRGVLLAGGLFVLGALGHTLQALYALAPLAGLILLRFAWRREWRAAGMTVAAVALGGAALAIFGLPVFSATLGTGAYADEGGGVRYSADLLAVVTPSFFHPIFGQWEYTHRVLGINLDEGAAFLGFSGLLLALFAFWKAPRSRFWWGVALVAWLLSLGPLLKVFDQLVAFGVDGYTSGVALPFAAVADWPLVRLARTPGRFNFLLGLAWAVILGWGLYGLLGWLSARVAPRRGSVLRAAVTVALSALLIFEFQTFWPVPTADAAIPDGVAALRERDDVRAVLDVPWDNLIVAKEGMYLQTAHGLPLIAGHVTRRTPVSPALLTMLQNTLDPARLREVGADVVIVHRQQENGALLARAIQQLGAPLYEDDRFAVFLTPDSGQPRPAATAGFVGGVITDHAESYLYAAEDGWWAWAAQLEADGREVVARLDGTIIGRWTVSGSMPVSAAFPLSAGYHVFSLALDPPCPEFVPAGQVCESLTVRNLAFEPLADGTSVPTASFRAPGEHGVSVTMQAALPTAVPGATLRVPLLWSFETARAATDTRFVHVVDTSGVLVAQQDNPLGAVAAGSPAPSG